MKKFRYLLVVGIILLDQIIKICIRNTMYIGESLPLIKDVFHITYVQNRGGAFSILSGQGFILTVGYNLCRMVYGKTSDRPLESAFIPLSHNRRRYRKSDRQDISWICHGYDRLQIFSCIQYSGYSRMRGSRFSDTLYPLLF